MKKINKALLILIFIQLVLNPTRSIAHGEDQVGPIGLNMFVGYQYGFGTKGYISKGFDADIVLFFINGGYSDKVNFGQNAYIGVGIGSGIQIQYGYAYKDKRNLLRIRTDFPLTFCSGNGFWRTLAIGLYYEKRFNDSNYSNNYGISLTIGIMNLIWSPEGRERNKK